MMPILAVGNVPGPTRSSRKLSPSSKGGVATPQMAGARSKMTFAGVKCNVLSLRSVAPTG
jgi:hypothetical protein